MINTTRIEQKISEALPGAQVQVRDMTGTQDHYEVTVISASFAGISPVARHRLVYAPVHDVLEDGTLHALKITARTPAEAAAKNSHQEGT